MAEAPKSGNTNPGTKLKLKRKNKQTQKKSATTRQGRRKNKHATNSSSKPFWNFRVYKRNCNS
eukprot:144003-Amphidinium_carterae.1